MTWNEQNKANSIMDVLEGTVEEWYDQVDGLLKASDFIPGNYEYSVNVAYANAGEFQEGGQTHVDISCDRFKIISLDNSYITLKVTFPINKPTVAAAASGHTYAKPKAWYIGFKSAFDAIDQYRIYSNSDLILTQNHANYESYLQYMSLSDSFKQNSELYATYDKVQAMNEDVPGVYVTSSIADADAATINVPIELRIPLNMFLMLGNLKWYPGFFGKLTLEIYPSYKNLVVLPVYPIVDAKSAAGVTEAQMRTLDAAPGTNGTNHWGFKQINSACTYAFDDTTSGGGATKAEVQCTFTCNTSTTNKCHIRLAETVVRMDIYNQILARFVNKPMLFPIQTIISKDFSGAMPTSAGSRISLTMTNALNHCNSMFIIFKRTNNDRTCFENPMIKWQVNIDGKYFPREEYQTYDDHKNMNLFLDATNFNGNGLFSVSNDIYHSLQPFVKTRAYAGAGDGTETPVYLVKDRSNFAIGVPFCEDDTFQAGIHSGGTVQVELVGSRTSIVPTLYASTLPTGLYVEDCILKLRAVKPSGEPQISFTHATPEQLLASAVVAN